MAYQCGVQAPLTSLSISAGGLDIRPWILNDSGLSVRRLSLSIQAPSPRRAQSTLGIEDGSDNPREAQWARARRLKE